MLRVHIYFKNEDEASQVTSRVTVRNGFLTIGTLPTILKYKMDDVESFWVERE